MVQHVLETIREAERAAEEEIRRARAEASERIERARSEEAEKTAQAQRQARDRLAAARREVDEEAQKNRDGRLRSLEGEREKLAASVAPKVEEAVARVIEEAFSS